MTRRHTSGFDILGFDSDPTPGDPDLILSQIVPTYQSIGDDAQTAFDALRGNAMQNGTGQTMDALRSVIGDKYPPKLQTTADSYHSAAQVYRTYAQSLSDAQAQVDKAMDQAQSVAGTANQAVPPTPANATTEQLNAVQTQQQNVDQANAQLTAAKRLAQDAKDTRDQAGNTFNSNLSAVSVVPERSFFQKLLDFFENCPLIKIIIDVAVAIATVFFPVAGLALGAVLFVGETALDTIATGHFDVGSFVAGLAGLALGGVGALAKFVPAIAEGAESLNSVARSVPGIGKFFQNNPVKAVSGLAATTKQVAKNFGTGFAKSAGVNAAEGLVGTGVDDAVNHQQFTGTQAGEIFGGAAVAGALGGASKSIEKQVFKGPTFAPPESGTSSATPTPVAAGAGDATVPTIKVTPPGNQPAPAEAAAPTDANSLSPTPDTRSDGEADSAAVGSAAPSQAPVDTPLPPAPTVIPPAPEGTIARKGFDVGSGLVQSLGGKAADVGIADALHDGDKTDDGNVGKAIADGATSALPGAAGDVLSDPLKRTVTKGPVSG